MWTRVGAGTHGRAGRGKSQKEREKPPGRQERQGRDRHGATRQAKKRGRKPPGRQERQGRDQRTIANLRTLIWRPWRPWRFLFLSLFPQPGSLSWAALGAQRLRRGGRWKGVNRQDARDARGLEEPPREVDAVASAVLQAAVEVHRVLGPGFLEGVYEQALGVELTLRRIPFVRQPAMVVVYKDHVVGDVRPDVLVAERLIVELKTVDRLAPIHLAQALSYLKATQLPLALVINFNVPVLLRGVRRVVLLAPAIS
jgi:GxxExxY protein